MQSSSSQSQGNRESRATLYGRFLYSAAACFRRVFSGTTTTRGFISSCAVRVSSLDQSFPFWAHRLILLRRGSGWRDCPSQQAWTADPLHRCCLMPTLRGCQRRQRRTFKLLLPTAKQRLLPVGGTLSSLSESPAPSCCWHCAAVSCTGVARRISLNPVDVGPDTTSMTLTQSAAIIQLRTATTTSSGSAIWRAPSLETQATPSIRRVCCASICCPCKPIGQQCCTVV